jgi:hypothetical protein
MDPVRLACVKHAASVHPEPESNPPQKNAEKPFNDSQKKKPSENGIDGAVWIRTKRPHKKPRRPLRPPGHPAQHQAIAELAIKKSFKK